MKRSNGAHGSRLVSFLTLNFHRNETQFSESNTRTGGKLIAGYTAGRLINRKFAGGDLRKLSYARIVLYCFFPLELAGIISILDVE